MDNLKPLTDKELEKLMEDEKNLIKDMNDKSWVKDAIEDMGDIISTIDDGYDLQRSDIFSTLCSHKLTG